MLQQAGLASNDLLPHPFRQIGKLEVLTPSERRVCTVLRIKDRSRSRHGVASTREHLLCVFLEHHRNVRLVCSCECVCQVQRILKSIAAAFSTDCKRSAAIAFKVMEKELTRCHRMACITNQRDAAFWNAIYEKVPQNNRTLFDPFLWRQMDDLGEA